MLKLGLIGFPLNHSFSKTYFEAKFKRENLPHQYHNYPIKQLVNLPLLLKETELNGFNITIPHKQNIISFLDEIDKNAHVINAVNTVLVKEGKLIGYNTDVEGFMISLSSLLLPNHARALILGNGGASKAVKFVLNELGIATTVVTRNIDKETINYQMLNMDLMLQHLLIVNCTPLGTFPNIEEFPNIPYQYITSNHLVYDLVYNPEKTAFLKKCEAQGAQIKNGLEMLHIQAEKAFEIWTK